MGDVRKGHRGVCEFSTVPGSVTNVPALIMASAKDQGTGVRGDALVFARDHVDLRVEG